MPQAPSNFVTLSAQCTSRLSSQNGEICLQKYLPISGKLSVTNFLKKSAVDCRSRLTIENTLKVEKKVYCFENKHNLSSPTKNAWGTCRHKHTKKLQSNNYAGTLPLKVFIASRALKMIRQYFQRHNGKRKVCSESMIKFLPIHFFVRNANIPR